MLTLILGGARSGKSELALRLAAASGHDVLFVATMQAGDDELRARIETHRTERPAHWRTIEEPLDVTDAVRSEARTGDFVVLDCVTLWVSNVLLTHVRDVDEIAPEPASVAARDVGGRVDAFVAWACGFDGDVAVVSNEVGLGVVPAYPLGRLFRDALGSANAAIARRAERVYQVNAGLVLDLNALGAQPLDAFGARTSQRDVRGDESAR